MYKCKHYDKKNININTHWIEVLRKLRWILAKITGLKFFCLVIRWLILHKNVLSCFYQLDFLRVKSETLKFYFLEDSFALYVKIIKITLGNSCRSLLSISFKIVFVNNFCNKKWQNSFDPTFLLSKPCNRYFGQYFLEYFWR